MAYNGCSEHSAPTAGCLRCGHLALERRVEEERDYARMANLRAGSMAARLADAEKLLRECLDYLGYVEIEGGDLPKRIRAFLDKEHDRE